MEHKTTGSGNGSLPVILFIKPAEEKAAKGFVAESQEDLKEYKYLDPESEILCSDPVHFLSERRCFIRYDKSIGLRFYHGDKNYKPDVTTIENAINDCKNIPAGCSLDFGVTDDGRTLLIKSTFSEFILGITTLIQRSFVPRRLCVPCAHSKQCARFYGFGYKAIASPLATMREIFAPAVL